MSLDPTIPFLKLDMPDLMADIKQEVDKLLNIQRVDNFGGYKAIRFYHPDEEFRQFDKLLVKYPFLFPHTLLFQLTPLDYQVIHRDNLPNPDSAVRTVSLNIPISGCNDTWVTEFFDIPKEDMFWSDKANAFVPKKEIGPLKKLTEYTLKENPVLVHTQIPHRIQDTNATAPRVSLSWTTQFTTWESALEFFSKYKAP